MSTRITVVYGGAEYAIRGRDIDDVQAEVTDAVTSGRPHWLEVASGAGRTSPARLLIAPGVPVALVEVAMDPGSHDPAHQHDTVPPPIEA